ncbi:hypothetical protein [Dryocola sp. LX212]
MNIRCVIFVLAVLISSLSDAAEITAECPAFNDNSGGTEIFGPDKTFYASWMCAYVSPGQKVYEYQYSAKEQCVNAFGGSNMSLIHCPDTEHGSSVPSVSCDLTIPDEVGGTVRWVPYEGNNYAYIKGAGVKNVCVNDVFAFPGTPPNPTPVNPVSCSATSVSIDHKNITPQEFNGSIASGKTNVSCSGGDGTVKLSFSTSSINLTNGGKSNLHFNNATGETTTTFTFSEDSTKTIDIYSVLSGSVSPGSFSGSTSLIMNVN